MKFKSLFPCKTINSHLSCIFSCIKLAPTLWKDHSSAQLHASIWDILLTRLHFHPPVTALHIPPSKSLFILLSLAEILFYVSVSLTSSDFLWLHCGCYFLNVLICLPHNLVHVSVLAVISIEFRSYYVFPLPRFWYHWEQESCASYVFFFLIY